MGNSPNHGENRDDLLQFICEQQLHSFQQVALSIETKQQCWVSVEMLFPKKMYTIVYILLVLPFSKIFVGQSSNSQTTWFKCQDYLQQHCLIISHQNILWYISLKDSIIYIYIYHYHSLSCSISSPDSFQLHGANWCYKHYMCIHHITTGNKQYIHIYLIYITHTEHILN